MSINGHSEFKTEEYTVEFRSELDDAWYNVRLVNDGDKLIVKYFNFDETQDNVYDADMFKSVEELEDFKRRFRPVSVQLQDNECSKVFGGMLVCTAHSSAKDDNRFYDAIVEEVKYKQHSFKEGEEECLCSFLLFWQHGPNAGDLMVKHIETICIVQVTPHMVPDLVSFVDKAKKRIESVPCNSSEIAIYESPVIKVKQTSTSPHLLTKEIECAKWFVSKLQSPKVMKHVDFCLSTRQDKDFGGLYHQYVILIDNLEKELSPLSVMEFVHKQTSISSQACVFPSSAYESYTRGAIMFDCEKDLNKVYDFLDNPNHIITSLKGRPWAITHKLLGPNTSRASIAKMLFFAQDTVPHGRSGIGNELKVVRYGTKIYEKAKEWKDIFTEFVSHQEGLHKRLVTEEKRILNQS